MQNRAQSATSVLQSVAGRRWQALCRPHPQNGCPPPRQAGQRSAVAENPESAPRRFGFAAVNGTGKNR
ncbi:hypothetical protein KKJ10_19820, partial [Xenorhabdus bovienii]|nr:hypothetical protein [Xenorhabdus bovienii]MDE9508425.1 hypothetical protein [Xenorhabdus bovienii]